MEIPALLAGTPRPVKRTLRCGLDCGSSPVYVEIHMLRYDNIVDFAAVMRMQENEDGLQWI